MTSIKPTAIPFWGTMGITAVRALTEATGFKWTESFVKANTKTGFKDVYYCNGHTFYNRGDLGRYMLEQINNWMLDAGIVKVEKLMEQRNSANYCQFQLQEWHR